MGEKRTLNGNQEAFLFQNFPVSKETRKRKLDFLAVVISLTNTTVLKFSDTEN